MNTVCINHPRIFLGLKQSRTDKLEECIRAPGSENLPVLFNNQENVLVTKEAKSVHPLDGYNFRRENLPKNKNEVWAEMCRDGVKVGNETLILLCQNNLLLKTLLEIRME